MSRAGSILLLLLLTACSAAGNSDSSEEPRRTEKSEESRNLRVERVASGASGQGPERPQVVMASSASALSEELGGEIPDSGKGTYLAAFGGRKPTGGYSLAVGSARLAEDRVTVRLVSKEPPPDAVVSQALTYPYTVAVVRGVELRGTGFSFVDGDGRELGWPVRRADG